MCVWQQPVYSVEFRTTMLGLRKAVHHGSRTLFGKRITDSRTLFLAIDRNLSGFVTRAELAKALRQLGLVQNEHRGETLMEEVPLLRERATSTGSPDYPTGAVDWLEFVRVSRVDGERSPPEEKLRMGSPQHAADEGRRARQQQLALESQMNPDHIGWQEHGTGAGSDLQHGSAGTGGLGLEPDRLPAASVDTSLELCMAADETRRAAFKHCDVNGQGWLNLHQVNNAASEIWPQLRTSSVQLRRTCRAAVAHAYHAADESDDGRIGRREFKLFCEYLVYFYRRWDSVFAKLGTVRSNGGIETCVLNVTQFKCGCEQLGMLQVASDKQFLELVRVSSETTLGELVATLGAHEVPLDVFASWCARHQRGELSHSATTATGISLRASRDGRTKKSTGTGDNAQMTWAQGTPSAILVAPSPLRDGERRSR
jgi:hypothetical protein